MLKTYHGSCHCGAVTFEADVDLSAGTSRCNCSICRKRRSWSVVLKPSAFRLLSGRDALADYQFGTKSGHHRFCRNCGIAPFTEGHVEGIGGDFVAIQISTLDDVTDAELAAAPIVYGNGRDNLWWEAPAETRHM